MAIREFGVIRVTCDNCGRHHDENVPLDQKYKYVTKTEAEIRAEEAKSSGTVYRYKRVDQDQYRWNEYYVKEKRKDMKAYLKANKWQVSSKQHVCRICLDEMTERILETVNDDSGS